MRRYARGRPLLVKHVRLVDLDRGRSSTQPYDILIEKSRFSLIAPSGEAPSPQGVSLIDARLCYALPGLVDSHAHMCGIFLTKIPGPRDILWMPRQILLNHRAQLRSGVTLVRDMMAPLRLSLLFRSLSQEPASGLPRVVTAGPMLTVPGGYPPYIPKDTRLRRALAGPLRVELAGRDGARAWVDRLARAGVDWIKIGYQSAGFDTARTAIATPPADLFRAIVERAHHHNLPVAVHHYWLGDLRELLDLPFDTLEHITEDAEIDEPTASKMAGRGLGVTTDLEQSAFALEPHTFLRMIEQGTDNLLPAPRSHIRRLLMDVASGKDIYGFEPPRKLMETAFIKNLIYRKMRNVKRLSEWGVRVAAATDSGVHMFMGILPRELCRLSEAGLGTLEILKAATQEGARLLGFSDMGRIAPGFRADMVLYREDPLANIEAVKNPEYVFREGVLVLRPSQRP